MTHDDYRREMERLGLTDVRVEDVTDERGRALRAITARLPDGRWYASPRRRDPSPTEAVASLRRLVAQVEPLS